MYTRRRFLKLGAAGVAGVATAGLASGCKDDGGTLAIGSKQFQEQWILAALIAELIERETDGKASSKDLGSTFQCHEAIKSGGIASYVEYTGTAYTAVLKHYPISDVDKVYERVKKEYRENFGILWLPPLGFENKYAILVRKQDAEEHGLDTISDLTKVQGEFRPGFAFEFYDRADGYRGMIEEYKLDFGPEPKQMEMGLMYKALHEAEVDVIAGNSTDGQIAALDLVMLKDDQGYFPPYYAAPLLRADVADEHPKVRAALESLGGTITADAMRRANYQVDSEKADAKTAAKSLLAELDLG